MKKTILVDVGIIIEYLKTGKGVLPKAYETYKMQITASTYVELLASSTFTDSALESEVSEFLKKYFEVIPVTEVMAQAASKALRGKDMSFASSIVAGAAIANSLELLTDQPGDFDGVEGLNLLKMD